MSTEINRRDFLKKGVIVAGAAFLAGTGLRRLFAAAGQKTGGNRPDADSPVPSSAGMHNHAHAGPAAYPMPPPSDPTGRGGPAATPAKGGAQLWSENCQRCHAMRNPASYNDAQWQVAVHHMQVRGSMNAEDCRRILQFLKSSD